MKLIKNLIIVLLLALVVACSGKSANETSRTPLKKIKLATSINVGQSWRSKVGNGLGRKSGVLIPHISGNTVFASAENGTLQATDIRTGGTYWQTKIANGLNSGVGGGLNTVYVASSAGQVLGISKQNGKLTSKSVNLGVLIAAPVAGSGTVIARALDGKIYGLGPGGNVIWQQDNKQPRLSIHRMAAPVFYGDKAILGLDDGNLMAINAISGTLSWLEPVAFTRGRNIIDRIIDVDATPILEGSQVYVVSFHGNLAKFDALTGTQIWSSKYSSTQMPAISGNKIIATHEEGFITAFDKNNGAKLWEEITLRGYDLIGPAAHGRYVAVGIKDSNVLFWLDSISGKIVAKHKVAGKKIMSLLSSAYGVIVYTEDGTLSLQRPL